MRIARTAKNVLIQESGVQSNANGFPRKTDLKNIIELTQQYEPSPPNETQTNAKQHSTASKNQLFNLARLKSYLNCLSNLWRYICYSPKTLELNLNDADLNSLIAKIKANKKQVGSVLPAQKEHKKVLVLDLDQTLINTTFNKPHQFDYESQILFNGKPTKIYTAKRFGLQSFLFQMSQLYEIIVFTTSKKLYADKMIDLIDPKKRISHRLYRQHCILVNKSYYLKNLNILGRNLQETVIVDDNSLAGMFQPENFYRILPFEGNDKDRQLCRLSAFLKHIHKNTSVLPIMEHRKQFEEMEINLQEEVTGQIRPQSLVTRSLNQRKKQYKHKKTNSEVEALVNTQAQTQAQTTASDLFKKL